MLWFPQPSALNGMIPWVCLGACWLSEVQWTAQIAWGVENSSVTGVLLSAKARWSFTVAALSKWNCFFSQETRGFAPLLIGPQEEMASDRLKTGPDQSYFSDAYLFLPSMYFLPIFFQCSSSLCEIAWIKIQKEKCVDMHEKSVLGIMHELYSERLLC